MSIRWIYFGNKPVLHRFHQCHAWIMHHLSWFALFVAIQFYLDRSAAYIINKQRKIPEILRGSKLSSYLSSEGSLKCSIVGKLKSLYISINEINTHIIHLPYKLLAQLLDWLYFFFVWDCNIKFINQYKGGIGKLREGNKYLLL